MNVTNNYIDKESRESDLLLANNLVNDFYLLENLLYKEDIENYKNEVNDLTKKIILYGDNIIDSGLKHDYNNAVMFIGKIQMIFDGLIHGDFKKFFGYAKGSVEDILLLKSSYNINDVKNVLIDLSFINNIKIDMIIEDGFFNSSNVISIENGDIISSNEYLFKGDNLKKVFPDINLEIRRIFQNLVKNSKEAGSTNISITFGILIVSGRLVIKYVDNGTGMTYNIIKDVLFKKGVTTKIDSGINKGEGMHGLSKMFYENEVDIDIYSKNLDSGFVGAGIIVDGFNVDEGKDNISGIVDITKTGYYKEDFPFETGTEFVLKFKQK